jgi:hypothetical protein
VRQARHHSAEATAPTVGPLLGALRSLARRFAALPRPLGWVLAGGWYLLIYGLSSNPGTGDPGPLGGGWILNTGHAALFGLLALWILMAYPREGAWPRLRPLGVGLLLGTVLLLGVLDELHQSSVPGRSTSVSDVVTDLTGALCVLWICAYAPRAAATEWGARARLALCLAACAAAGALATLTDHLGN